MPIPTAADTSVNAAVEAPAAAEHTYSGALQTWGFTVRLCYSYWHLLTPPVVRVMCSVSHHNI